jgi:hypothetical protein
LSATDAVRSLAWIVTGLLLVQDARLSRIALVMSGEHADARASIITRTSHTDSYVNEARMWDAVPLRSKPITGTRLARSGD